MWNIGTSAGQDSKCLSVFRSSAPNYLLATEPSLETRQFSLLAGVAERRGRELGKERQSQGWETNKMWCTLSGSCKAGSFRAAHIFQDAFSLRCPTPDTPMPSFQPRPLLHHQPGEGAGAWQRSQFSWISFTVIFINLNAQGAEGDWRKLFFRWFLSDFCGYSFLEQEAGEI